ncbi:glycoside hydrolase family 26 protein [Streptacidiphilus melanogenes]|uniref:glycoside hydrolase family 26 protein n=1 Tax=Streptacidiphilus melanogenes TaxID=411235 RepID=UPI0006941E07|nr:glycosyl hydrolase [Streptacidiphilus melanogenes]
MRTTRAALLALLLVLCAGCTQSADGAARGAGGTWGAGPTAGATVAKPDVPTVAQLLHPDGDYFGVSTVGSPQPQETASVVAAAGQHPTILEYFRNWTQPFDADAVRESWHEGAVPLLTWEPASQSKAADQPQYALKRIADGAFDTYVTQYALAVKAVGLPVIIRFAHEMNGNWYPWSEQNSGNAPGDYVRAWRHVHDVFTNAGVTNAIWLWSPNTVRGTPEQSVQPYFPGVDYVDMVGVDAYGFGEKTAQEVLDPTVVQLQALTRKPILIAETGAQPGAEQAGWTASLFTWLHRHPQVVGFVWFEHSVAEGAWHDYRFTVDPATEAAFRAGLAGMTLRSWPVASVLPSAAASSG